MGLAAGALSSSIVSHLAAVAPAHLGAASGWLQLCGDLGGVFGPLHDHKDRPGTVYVLQGTITDHRNGVTTDYGPGVGWPEDRNTTHWLENRGTIPAVEISVDIVSQE